MPKARNIGGMMKKLHSHARTTEVDHLSDMLIKLWASAEGVKEDTFLKNTFAEITTLSDKITEAIKRDVAVSKLEEMDHARDEKIRALGTLIDGYAVIPVAEMQTHGAALQAVFKKYGTKITNENYASESALIESLLKDLAASDAKAHIDALTGMADSVSALRSAQDDFDKAQLEYDAAKAKQSETASASAVKKPLVACINDKLVTYLNTMVMVDGAKYSAFAAMVETEIDRVNSEVSGRTTKK